MINYLSVYKKNKKLYKNISILLAGGCRKCFNIKYQDIFCKTIMGAGKKINQDSYLVWINKEKKIIVGAVFDGHGLEGHIASTIAKDVTNRELDYLKDMINKENIESILKILFDTIQKEIKSVIGQRRYSGGTTGVIIVQFINDDKSRTIVSANAGDSEALLIYKPSICEQKTEIENHLLLTTSHGVGNLDECKRIAREKDSDKTTTCGKSLELVFYNEKTKPGPSIWNGYKTKGKLVTELEINHKKHKIDVNRYTEDDENDTYYNTFLEPFRNAGFSFAGDGSLEKRAVHPNGLTIAFTRSLGDFEFIDYGFTHKPEIDNFDIPYDTQYAVLVASDGIWDIIKKGHIGTLYWDNTSCNYKRSKILFKKIVEDAIKRFSDSYDDTTLITWDNKLFETD